MKRATARFTGRWSASSGLRMLLDLAVDQHRDAIGEFESFFAVVGNDDRGQVEVS